MEDTGRATQTLVAGREGHTPAGSICNAPFVLSAVGSP